MARRRAPALERSDETVMPLELTRYERDEWPTPRDYYRARSDWFRAHGVDPGDWSAVHPILAASGRHHGYPLAMDRARLRLQPGDTSG